MTTYYLNNEAASANDSNSGTSASTPFMTLAALNAVILKPGDTVEIAAGTS